MPPKPRTASSSGELMKQEPSGDSCLLSRRDGVYFYQVFQMMSVVAAESISEMAAKKVFGARGPVLPIRWNHKDAQRNSASDVLRVSHHILEHHSTLMETIRSAKGDRLRKIDEARSGHMGRKDMKEMQSW